MASRKDRGMAQPKIKLFVGGTEIEAEMNEWMAEQPATTLIYQPDIAMADGLEGILVVACVTYKENANSPDPSAGTLIPESP